MTHPVTSTGILSLCKASCRLYQQHGLAFTRPLLLPMWFQFIGSFLAIVAPYRILNTMTAAGVVENPVAIIGLTLLVLIPATYLFTEGFWKYLVYMASLNVNVLEVLQGKKADFKKAYGEVEAHSGAFTQLLLLLMGLWVFPLFAFLIPGGLMMLLPPDPINAVLMGAGILLCLFFGLVCLVISVYLCLSFQVFAVEVPPLTPWGVLKRSFQLVDGHFWQAVAILCVVMILTNILLPGGVTLVFDLTHLTAWIAQGVQGILQELLDSIFPVQTVTSQPFLAMLHQYSQTHLALLSTEITRSLLYSLVTGLLLPLGTFFFAAFYQDLVSRQSMQKLHAVSA